MRVNDNRGRQRAIMVINGKPGSVKPTPAEPDPDAVPAEEEDSEEVAARRADRVWRPRIAWQDRRIPGE